MKSYVRNGRQPLEDEVDEDEEEWEEEIEP